MKNSRLDEIITGSVWKNYLREGKLRLPAESGAVPLGQAPAPLSGG